MKKILAEGKIPFNNVTLPYIYTYCLLGKSHKLTFIDSLTKYDEPLELIATDLRRPTPVNLDYGYR